jgi:hypothetical protein
MLSYLPAVECAVSASDKFPDTEIVGVQDAAGKSQFLRVSKGFVVRDEDKHFLPIGIVDVDFPNKQALIELPSEADSGLNRMWIPFGRFRQENNGA